MVFLARLNGFGAILFVLFFSVLTIGGESAARRVGVPTYFTLVLIAHHPDHAGDRSNTTTKNRRASAGRCASMDGLFTEHSSPRCWSAPSRPAVPLLLAGLGEQMSEKAGVLNIGIEGMMLGGAYAGFLAASSTGSLWLGLRRRARSAEWSVAVADGDALRAPRAQPDRHRHRRSRSAWKA